MESRHSVFRKEDSDGGRREVGRTDMGSSSVGSHDNLLWLEYETTFPLSSL